jgi:glutamate synthase (NADPH/NADH) large chain
VATQNPVLRKRFNGKPEFVENFFLFLAEEVRGYLAELGFRTMDEAIGQVELLDMTPAVDHWKARGLDLSRILHVPAVAADATVTRRRTRGQDHALHRALDNELIARSQAALEQGEPVEFSLDVRNENRSVGAMLGGEVARRYCGEGLPEDTIAVRLRGTAGQSFGAFVPKGVTLRLYGDANDYVGKGLSGGRLVVRPDDTAPFARPDADGLDAGAEHQIIAGNTILYGATGGELYLRGRVGERFAVRNSGAAAVVEGVGDHGCEYMTGGTVVVLGPTGRNFAAGMSGGFAYVWQLDASRVNPELVDLLEVTGEHAQTLHRLVQRHYDETASPVAGRLLAAWPQALGEFTAVVPRDYERAVRVIRAAQAAGREIDESVMAELSGSAPVKPAAPAQPVLVTHPNGSDPEVSTPDGTRLPEVVRA